MRVPGLLVPALLVLANLVLAAVLASPAAAADLVLKRVMLSTAGVGYFEYEAAVDGPGTLGLDVKLDQVDDVLKSLVVFDSTGGVGGIELPGRDDVPGGTHQAFADLPFEPGGLASPLAFLNGLQGVEVTVEGPRPMAGCILRAEEVTEPPSVPNAPAPRRTRVSLLTEGGLRQFVLEDADAVQVADPGLRARIARALAATRRENAQDMRHIAIRTTGTGARTVRVSYVAAAPVWKASYRLVLPAPGAPKARLQGWATFENATGADWSGVALSVQYGNPVTFRQAIYQSYYVTRPEVPVEVLGRLLPGVDTRARAASAPSPAPPSPASSSSPSPRAVDGSPPALAIPSQVLKQAEPAPILASGGDQAASQEGAEETLFVFAAPVSLVAGHSASVPILDGDVPAARVALLMPEARHPLAAVRLANDTSATLPAGVLTLYGATGDSPYAGDARLGGVAAHESRLVSYAQDLRTTAEWRVERLKSVVAVKASGGMLTTTQRLRSVAHVTVTAPVQEPRHVLFEMPKYEDLALAPGFAQPVEETASAWRFSLGLASGETRTLSVAMDHDEVESITMLESPSTLLAVSGLSGLPEPARAGLARIVALRTAETVATTERDRLTAQQGAIDADETRLRENLGALQPTDALRTRLVRQLDADETRHAQLATALDAANAAVDKAHAALAEAIQSLRL